MCYSSTMQYSSNEAAMMNHQPAKQDCLPITPHRRDSSSVASAGAATFHDDSADQMFVKLDMTSRRESLKLDQLNSFKKSYRKKRMEEYSKSSSINGKSFTSSWQSMGSSISSVFSSIRSLNIVVLDEDADHDNGHELPRLRRSSINLNTEGSNIRQLQWQRSESVGAAGGLNPPKIPKRRSSWGWKKSSLHSNATSSAGTKSRRSSLRSSLTSWTGTRKSGRRSSSGSITTLTPEEQLPLPPRYYSGEQDTFPLRPWRRASLAASIGVPVESILEGGELEEQGSSNLLLGLSNHSTNHQQRHAQLVEEEGVAAFGSDSDSENDDEPPVARCSETTQKITNAAITAATSRPSYMWDDIEEEASGCSSQQLVPLEEPPLIARASAVTVKATNSDYSSSTNGARPPYPRSSDEEESISSSLMKSGSTLLVYNDDSFRNRWADGSATSSNNFLNNSNKEELAIATTARRSSSNTDNTTTTTTKDQGLSMPIRLESAHTTTTSCSIASSSGGCSSRIENLRGEKRRIEKSYGKPTNISSRSC